MKRFKDSMLGYLNVSLLWKSTDNPSTQNSKSTRDESHDKYSTWLCPLPHAVFVTPCAMFSIQCSQQYFN